MSLKIAVLFLMGESSAPEFYVPTFRIILSVPPSLVQDQWRWNSVFQNVGTKFHPKEKIQLSEHGESLKSRTLKIFLTFNIFFFFCRNTLDYATQKTRLMTLIYSTFSPKEVHVSVLITNLERMMVLMSILYTNINLFIYLYMCLCVCVFVCVCACRVDNTVKHCYRHYLSKCYKVCFYIILTPYLYFTLQISKYIIVSVIMPVMPAEE